MGLRGAGLLLALGLGALGLLTVGILLIAVPLGLGGAGFGYKKVLALLLGLEFAFCGVLLWRRLRALS